MQTNQKSCYFANKRKDILDRGLTFELEGENLHFFQFAKNLGNIVKFTNFT